MSDNKNSLVYREQLDDNVIEMLSEDIGSNYSLRTENQKTIVAALNEIHGKDVISNAVGSPLLSTDTFAEMGEKIKGLTADFKSKLLGLGVVISGTDKLASLIEKLSEIDLGLDVDELLKQFAESLNAILKEYGAELTGNETLTELIVKVDELLSIKQEIIDKAEEKETNKSYLYYILKSVGFNINDDDDEMTVYKLLDYSCNYPINVKQISCGNLFTFIIKNDNTLWACGSNTYGQLGLGDTDDRTVFTQITDDIKQVVCGSRSTFIIKNDDSLWACGYNNNGQLGLGDNTNRTTFTQVATNVKQVASGYRHTFMLKNDGTLWSCGYNNGGQLGFDSDEVNVNTFTQLDTDISDIKQIVCGLDCSFIVKNDGTLWACGYNNRGQLGFGDTESRPVFTQVTDNVKYVSSGGYTSGPSATRYANSFIIKNDNTLWACGYNSSYGILGLNDGDDRNVFTQVTTNVNNDVSQVSCSGYHTCILKTDGSVWTCGFNGRGQLGTGDTSKRMVFTQVSDDARQICCSCTCSTPHTVIIKNDDTILSCGNNDNGQLGLGADADVTQKTFTRLNSFNI